MYVPLCRERRRRLMLCARFLVEGDKGAVLHTGDLRAEPWFLNSLRHNPYIQRYLDTSSASPLSNHRNSSRSTVLPKLEAIYLDTACLLNAYDVPNKVRRVPDRVVIPLLTSRAYRQTQRVV